LNPTTFIEVAKKVSGHVCVRGVDFCFRFYDCSVSFLGLLVIFMVRLWKCFPRVSTKIPTLIYNRESCIVAQNTDFILNYIYLIFPRKWVVMYVLGALIFVSVSTIVLLAFWVCWLYFGSVPTPWYFRHSCPLIWPYTYDFRIRKCLI
jgi:hypothetical protein